VNSTNNARKTEKLSQISDNFEEIEGLDEATSRSLVDAASMQLYNASVTLIFVILMSVKLHRAVLRVLLDSAMNQMKARIQNNDLKDRAKKVLRARGAADIRTHRVRRTGQHQHRIRVQPRRLGRVQCTAQIECAHHAQISRQKDETPCARPKRDIATSSD
jgi:Na+-transporting NADH:ubiquinone oxidoreductase subunit NqrC